MNTILICDDDKDIVSALDIYLTSEGYATVKAYDGLECLRLAEREPVDLILLDVMMPGLDGIRTTAKLRESCNVPIILLTAKSEDSDKILGLNIGADDYITKPFLPQELLLRLAAVLRRVYGAGAGEVLRLGAAEVHWGTGTVRRPGGGEAALTAKEYALHKKLAANRGNIVTIDALCQALWEGPMVGYENTLMVHIRRLREKLETDPSHPQYLLTVRGLGYRLAQEERL